MYPGEKEGDAMNIIVLDNREKVIHFLNPDLVDIVETFEDGLRSIEVKYNIEEFLDAKQYFKQGHKIFINPEKEEENVLTTCLYVLNTEVKQDLFKENTFSFTAEEVLVELNYAPFFTQTELSNSAFTTSQLNGETAVTVNYNSLNYWFGEYFNIGIVQDCISTYASKITFTGSMPLMTLLRYIEEETGNIFVTRYEKDVLTNSIHRYLDFLNPVSQNKNWSTYFEYDFIAAPAGGFIVDDEGHPVDDDDEELDDEIPIPSSTLPTNMDLAHTQFRITYDDEIITTEEDEIELCWNAADIGISSRTTNIAIQIRYYQNQIGIKVHNKTFTAPVDAGVGADSTSYISTIASDPTYIDDDVLIPKGSCFEFYDSQNEKVIYSRSLNPILSEAREDVLDLGYNVENISFSIDESDTYTAISPILGSKNNSGASNSLSHNEIGRVITAWRNLAVTKGYIIPMIVQKFGITGTDEYPCTQRIGIATSPNRSAEQILGERSISSNYYQRPYKPNDNTEGTNKTYEYWKGTAYWRAPFTKPSGQFHIELEDENGIEYQNIRHRPDKRSSVAVSSTPKMGQVETSEEDVYAIYNAVAMKLKEKQHPEFKVTVDVANYRDGQFNNYDAHDKVYVKLPGTNGLVIAKVVKTVKSLHDLSENKITLDNYSVNTKEITNDTYIEASNIQFKYPSKKQLTVTLKNANDDSDKLSNKLITFVLYTVENGSSTLSGIVYTKKTNANGQATINCGYWPGDYEMAISFSGDAEYTESSTTVLINVSGVKPVKKTNTNKNTTAVKYKNVKRYWSKYGLSPDKKTVKAIGRPSSGGEVDEYGYTFWETEFENYCPKCHKKGTLMWGIFWAGNEYSNYGRFPGTGNGEGSSAEGAVFCSNQRCDGDWSIFGKEHGYENTRLRVKHKPVRSSKSRAYQLKSGKLYYDTQKQVVSQKNVTNKQTRVVVGSISNTVKNQALSIVGNSTGKSALFKICNWMDSKIWYSSYGNFQRSPETVLSTRHGNCCDQTRLILQLFDAAGLTQYYHMYYVHVYEEQGHVYAMLKNKSTNKSVYIDPASDVHGCYAYVCQGYSHGSPASTYPNRPF